MKKSHKSICKECEWHVIRTGKTIETDWINEIQTITHNVMVDSCIHPIKDDRKEFNYNGKKLYDVIVCSKRNKNGKCKLFQPKRNILIKLFQLRKKRIDIYNEYKGK